MYDTAQLMKGVLEGCMLMIISRETAYGYKITTELQAYGFENMREGTTYPILMRLEKRGYISAELRPSPLGPARKYYSITPLGSVYLEEFRASWQQASQVVNSILEGRQGDDEALAGDQ